MSDSKSVDRDQVHKLVASLLTLNRMQDKLGERAAAIVLTERRISELEDSNPLLRGQSEPLTVMLGRTYGLVQECVVGQAEIAVGYLKRSDDLLRPLFGADTVVRINAVVEKLFELQASVVVSAPVLLGNVDRLQALFDEILAFGRLVNHRWPILDELPSPAMFGGDWTWPEAREKGELYVKLNGWPGSNRKLAEAIDCPYRTMDKAVKSSVYLAARKAEYERSKAGAVREVQTVPGMLEAVAVAKYREADRLISEKAAQQRPGAEVS